MYCETSHSLIDSNSLLFMPLSCKKAVRLHCDDICIQVLYNVLSSKKKVSESYQLVFKCVVASGTGCL